MQYAKKDELPRGAGFNLVLGKLLPLILLSNFIIRTYHQRTYMIRVVLVGLYMDHSDIT